MPPITTPRIRKLRKKQQKLINEIRGLQEQIRLVEKGLGVRSGGVRGRLAELGRRPNARRLNEITVKDAVVDLLREKRRPMHYKDITKTLLKEGRYRTRSRNFLSTVAISIMRDRRVKRVEPGVYTLRKS